MNLTTTRWVIVLVFAAVSVAIFVSFTGSANDVASAIRSDANANEKLSESAPQQQVVASWAIRDAELQQVRQNGTRNGLLGICAAMLTSLAVSTAIRDQSDPDAIGGPYSDHDD